MTDIPIEPDEPNFDVAADRPKTMTAKALAGTISRDQPEAHTHEAHPTVWVQQLDPRWLDADHTQANTALKIGDLWVDKDFEDYDESDGWGTQYPYTRIFDGSDWREVASSESSTPPLSYTHVQTVASATWTVVHNLGYRPSVTVVDTADTQIIPGVRFVDENSVEVTFTGATAGKAYCS